MARKKKTVIAGNVIPGGDAVMGDQYNITQINPAPPSPSLPDLAALRSSYCDHLRRTYHALDFKGIPQLDNLSRELALEDVYVSLLARPELLPGEVGSFLHGRLAGRKVEAGQFPEEALAAFEKTRMEPVAVEQAIDTHPRVVVLGDPGPGKTTLLKHLVLRLARTEGSVLPILIPLSAYAAALAHGECNLQNFLARYFADLAQGVAGLEPLFDDALSQGRALVLLDGLDEVQGDRPRLVHKVEAFTREAVEKGNKVVVTSRIVGYRESSLAGKDWALYTLRLRLPRKKNARACWMPWTPILAWLHWPATRSC